MQVRSPFARVATAATVVLALAVPFTSGSVSSAAATKSITGPDVSHYQHPGGAKINWKKVAKAGKVFAISKATEGTTYNDPYFATDYPAELAAGLVHGAYHFAHPALPLAPTAMAQAKFFEAAVGAVNTAKTLPPALDLEQTGGLSPGQLVTWAQDFLLDMRTLTGRTPMLYTYPDFWENDLDDPTALARYPLWMAEYGTSTAPIADVWQYTDHAHIKGIPGAVDESRFLGTTGFPWATLSNGTVATPWTPAVPAAPVAVQASAAGGAVTVSWLPGDAGTSRVSSYAVTASPGGKVVTVGPNTFNATLTGLSTTTAYTFTVTATNAVGTGVASTPTPPVTPTIPTVLAAKVKPLLTYGKPLPLQAQLRRADNHQALPNQQVLIFRRSSVSSPWRQIRKLSTDSSGQVTATLMPKVSAQLEAVFPGAAGVARASTFDSYRVRPTVTAALSSTTVKHGGKVAIRGAVTPFYAGTQVKREALVNGRWQVWARSKLGPKGGFKFVIHTKAKTKVTYRIVVVAAKGRASAASPHLTLTVD